jgi:hypothetical protein
MNIEGLPRGQISQGEFLEIVNALCCYDFFTSPWLMAVSSALHVRVPCQLGSIDFVRLNRLK